jgi:hypothetical protein
MKTKVTATTNKQQQKKREKKTWFHRVISFMAMNK